MMMTKKMLHHQLIDFREQFHLDVDKEKVQEVMWLY
ncbi:uncharacterized protein METZ01_LOCUS514235 [marine metagenome]|uniref:Uncharacterized protein n=1 Tax=marine metagenome TaxID=408172 RepID=A0A383EXA9_9ZZZZ